MSEENAPLAKILEGAILAAGEPLSIAKIQSLFAEEEIPEKDDIEQALAEIKQSCEGRGFNLVEVASGWRFQVREDVAVWVNRLWEEKPQKYSRALLETLALVAYRQPITRGDIEEVRGVAVSSNIIKTLTERDWVKVVGHRDVPGRPALYATTRIFLDYFNLKSLEELPTLGELKDIEGFNDNLDFDEQISDEPSPAGEQSVGADDSETASSEDESAADQTTEESAGSDEPQKIMESTGINDHDDGEALDQEFEVLEADEKIDFETEDSSEYSTEKSENEQSDVDGESTETKNESDVQDVENISTDDDNENRRTEEDRSKIDSN